MEISPVRSPKPFSDVVEDVELKIQRDPPMYRPPRHNFANPMPLGFMGFILSDLTFSAVLMGWGGARSLTGVVGIFFFTGPVLLLMSMIFEWIMGLFVPMMISGLFSVFWLSFGMLQLPSLGIAASYSSSGNAEEGSLSVEFNAAVGLYAVVWGFVLATLFLMLLRTNVIRAAIIGFASLGSFLIASAYWKVAAGELKQAETLQKAGGAVMFIVGMLGWYMMVALIGSEMGTFKLPLGDLSQLWRPSDEEEQTGRVKRHL